MVSNGQAKVNEIVGDSMTTDRERNMTLLMFTDGMGVPNCKRNATMLPSTDGIGVPNCAVEVMTVQKALVWAQDDEGSSRSHCNIRIIDPTRW